MVVVTAPWRYQCFSEQQADEPQLAPAKVDELQTVQIWRKTGIGQSNSSAAETAFFHLQNINRALQAETCSAPPHLCMQDVSTSQIYILVTLAGSASRNGQLMREAVRFFNLLIDSEEVDFIEDGAFADRLISFIRIAAGTGQLTPDAESEMVELLFATAAKLRHRPTMPPAWFRPDDDTTRKCLPQTRLTDAKSQDFPLVYLLLEYVYHEGKTGDFARTGLLYLLEIAGRAEKLERWIIESELPTMMASGLGALYSQLSSKIALSYPRDSMPSILAFSDLIDSAHRVNAEPIFSTALQANLATFISFLIFWQDVLERCPSTDIKATLLDHFDFLFLRPLLYPSLVESSDVDGGSSVAVMTYLTYILESLNDPQVIRLLLCYMLGAPAPPSHDSKPSRPSTLARRRKSQTLISNSAIRADDPSPDLITLTNILHGYLSSHNYQTVIASLRLLVTILRSWHDFANTTLMKVQTCRRASRKRLKSTHDQQLEVLYSLAEDILDDDSLETLYESHLQDAQVKLETHPCSAAQLLLPVNIAPYSTVVSQKMPDQPSIVPDDPLLACLMSLMENFLVNDIVVNLSLSEALAALASCGEIQLESWLLGPLAKASDDTGVEDVERPEKFSDSNSRPRVASPVFARLESLVRRIDRLKRDIQDFDIHLAERRHIFKVGGEIDDSLADVPVRSSHESQGRKQSSQRAASTVGSSSERLEASPDVSRSVSPRGRQQDHAINNHPHPKSLVGRLSHLRLSPSPNQSNPLERTYSPSPLRRQSVSSLASSPIPSPRGPPDALRQKVRLKLTRPPRHQARENNGSETNSLYSETSHIQHDDMEEFREVSLSQLLTNVIILQEFILELAAILQVRASLFGEVSLQ
ncbi:MAG: hypothetical protein LQ338_003850 [Usnochroma carphineum]|nr:MAG: hypothetical protein LQ338_003850 [Usnochroma carphineum]